MKKKTISIIIVLVLSIVVNINNVNAIKVNGEEWDKECNYTGARGKISLYIKKGSSMIKLTISKNNIVYTYSGENLKEHIIDDVKYTIKNKVVINDGMCPVIMYEEYDSSYINYLNIPIVFYKYSVSENGGDPYILEIGNTSMSGINNDGYTECGGIIDKTIKDMINKYLRYVHIIVPIMILALGVYDFFRAMMASKEEELKKSQKRFIIRLVAGVLVFLAPTIVNLIIDILNTGACAIK